MATRCNIHFNQWGRTLANIYQHGDGYPGKVVEGKAVEGGVLADLLVFYNKLLAEVRDNRLDVAEDLAAKFLVWKADELAMHQTYGENEDGTRGFNEDRKHSLDFLGVAPCIEDHGDIEYVYELDCEDLDALGCPVVRWKPCGGRFRKVYLHGKPASQTG